MRSVPSKSTSDTYTAEEFNELMSQELQNAVLESGQTLDAGDLTQLGKALAIYGAAGDFYTDGGAADAYVLTPQGTRQAPPTLIDGMRVRFIAGNTNTGASTVNVNGIGVTAIEQGGSALVGGEIVTGQIIELSYNTSNASFTLVFGLLAKLGLQTKGGIIYYDGNKAPVLLPIGTLNHILSVTASGIPGWIANAAGGRIKHGTVHTAISGVTNVEWLAIPAGVDTVEMALSDISLDGTENFELQLGSSGAYATSGYTGNVNNAGGNNGWSGGALMARSISAGIFTTMNVVMRRITGNKWQINGNGTELVSGSFATAGDVTLAGELTRIKLKSVGTDLIDAGAAALWTE